jgi:hypothetical protein
MVVDHLNTQAQNQNVGVACIYLNHKETEVQTVSNLLSGLWRQLVFGKDVTSQVQELYKQHTEKGTRPLLDNIHLALCAAITQFSKVYIVVDAVDEYPENQWHLHPIEIRSTVNLMITSRPHITPIADSVVLQICANDKDIQSYVDGYIKQSPQLSKLVKMKPELKEKIGTKMRNTVDGMYVPIIFGKQSVDCTEPSGSSLPNFTLSPWAQRGHPEQFYKLWKSCPQI